ncbi:MAG: PIG-L deacetylase family protein [Calothrix sp. MO_167.B42]|nr:PIG-L deacetylase family protein [Calothrix sp. MO_167.B42]
MNKSLLKSSLRRLYRSLVNFRHIELDSKQLEGSAIIFAPHQDDETLGCGGTIIRKKQAGADLKIVFMTDGSSSHSLIDSQELKAIRREEALAAAKKLGVEPWDVIFLEVKDGKLSNNIMPTIQRVSNIIIDFLPQEIFIPYGEDGPPDHNVTNHIVIAALKKCEFSATIYEYPIWFWNHWPWTQGTSKEKNLLSFFKSNLIPELNLQKEFRTSVYIGDVLERKQAALNEHKSQFSELIPHPHWWTLQRVSQGEFLECFLQNYELFCQYKIRGI